jgi:hypothetical protein
MIAYLRSLDRKAALAGLAAVALLSAGIVLGSDRLRHYDRVLLTYTFGTLFSAFAVVYRYTVWLQRPATRMYVRRGLELLRRGNPLRNLWTVTRAAREKLVAQTFIRRRSFRRWFIHFNLAWGTMLAGAVTFPLVFGWLHFESRLEDPGIYEVVLLNVPVFSFRTDSPVRFVMFNLLNLSAVMVIVGALLALHRRLKNEGSATRQQFGNDILPLLLLLAISGTGLLLTFSTHALGGAGYPALSLLHAVVVSATLLYIPFGKFFHIFQRPAQMGVVLYRRENERMSPARCRVCGEGFAGPMHLADLKEVFSASGFGWDRHLETCPRCKRRMLGVARPPSSNLPGRFVAHPEWATNLPGRIVAREGGVGRG